MKQLLVDLPLTQIDTDRANRQNLGDIAGLARDIEQRGLLYPIVVVPYVKTKKDGLLVGADALKAKKYRYWLCDGERRYRAVAYGGGKKIQALIKTADITLIEMYEIMFAANAKRLDMNPFDMANAIDRYIREFLTAFPDKSRTDAIRRLQATTGFSQTYLESRLDILDAPEATQIMVKNQAIGANVPTEIKHNIPEAYRDYAFERVEEDKVISTLEFREAGRQIRALDRMKTLTDREKHRVAKSIIDTGGRTNWNAMDKHGDYPLYLGEIEKFRLRIDLWNLSNISPEEQADLAGRINDLAVRFRNKQKISQGITQRGELRMNHFKRQQAHQMVANKTAKRVVGKRQKHK